MSIGDRFSDAREKYNQHGKQSQTAVAQATGLAKSVISNLENEKKSDTTGDIRDVGFSKIVTLANYYDVSIDWLLTGRGDPKRAPCAVDDLNLSVDAVEWLKSFTRIKDGDDYSKHFSQLLEMECFRLLFYHLSDYFNAMQAASIDKRIFESSVQRTDEFYPQHTTYAGKLRSAINDPAYSDGVRSYLKARYEGMDIQSLPAFFSVLYDVDGFDINEILERRIAKSINSVVEQIGKMYEK
jgi:transcriptional regulator with XRE-family HTH domain